MGGFAITNAASVGSTTNLGLTATTTLDISANGIKLNDIEGANGQVFSIDSNKNPVWTTIAPTLANVLTNGDTANKAINMGGFAITNAASVGSTGALSLNATGAVSFASSAMDITIDVSGSLPTPLPFFGSYYISETCTITLPSTNIQPTRAFFNVNTGKNLTLSAGSTTIDGYPSKVISGTQFILISNNDKYFTV